MKKLFTLTGAFVLVFAMLVIPAAGQSSIQVSNSEAEPSFAEQVVFRLEAESESPITEVILFYREMLEAETRAGARGAIAASTQVLEQVIHDQGFESYETFVLGRQA